MRFELNVLNVFNQKTIRHRFNVLNRNRSAARLIWTTSISRTDTTTVRMIAAMPERLSNAIEPRYNMPDLWSDGAQGHFMVKFLF